MKSHSNPLFFALVAALVIGAGLLVLIVYLLDAARTSTHDDPPLEGARMSRRQRAAIMRERLDLNPAFRRDRDALVDPRGGWRLP